MLAFTFFYVCFCSLSFISIFNYNFECLCRFRVNTAKFGQRAHSSSLAILERGFLYGAGEECARVRCTCTEGTLAFVRCTVTGYNRFSLIILLVFYDRRTCSPGVRVGGGGATNERSNSYCANRFSENSASPFPPGMWDGHPPPPWRAYRSTTLAYNDNTHCCRTRDDFSE